MIADPAMVLINYMDSRDAKMKILRSMTSYLPDKILNDLNTWGEVPVVPVVDQFEVKSLLVRLC